MKRIVTVSVALILVGAALFWFLTSPARQGAGLEPVAPGQPDLANGEVMFYAGGCIACHATPKRAGSASAPPARPSLGQPARRTLTLRDVRARTPCWSTTTRRTL